MRIGRPFAAAFVVVSLAGCGKEAGVYDLPLHDAYERLAHNTLEDFKLARQCGILIHISPEPIQDHSVTWRVFSSDEEQLNFTARLVPVGAKKTRIDLDVSKDPDGAEAYSGDNFYPHPTFHQPLRPAIREAIDAILAGRPFDVTKTPNAGKNESVCRVQRGGLEATGRPFSIHDKAGEWGGQ